MHWERVKRHGDPHFVKVEQTTRGLTECSVSGCGKPHHAKGFCSTHAQRFARHGNPEFVKRVFTREYFESCIEKKPDGCWLWNGVVLTTGYGQFFKRLAHRVSYEFYKGAIPAGALIMHSCDVRNCVNPDHLSPGTPKANSDDMVSKGRGRFKMPPAGCDNPNSKFSPGDVAEIRRAHAMGSSMRALARHYGVAHKTISNLVRGRRYVSAATEQSDPPEHR